MSTVERKVIPIHREDDPQYEFARLRDPNGGDMVVRELTPKVAEQAVCNPTRRRIIRCGKKEGFQMAITKKNVRTWQVEMRSGPKRKQRQQAIGRVTTMNITTAHAKMRDLVAEGTGVAAKDISKRVQAKVKRLDALTWKQASEEYLAASDLETEPLAEGSKTRYRNSLKLIEAGFAKVTNVVAMWDATGDDCNQVRKEICRAIREKTKGRCDGTTSAYNAMRYVSILWHHHARVRRHKKLPPAPDCPTMDLNMTPPRDRDGTIEDHLIYEWWNSLDKIPMRKGLEATVPVWTLYLRSLLLVSCRKTEWLKLEWDWVDLQRAIVTIPREVTKTKKVKHQFPIGPVLTSWLKAHRATQKRGTQWVFAYPEAISWPALRGTQMAYSDNMIKKHRKVMKRHYELHDLRRTHATKLIDLEAPEAVQDKFLNHNEAKRKNTTRKYQKISIDTMRKYQDRVEAMILELVRNPTGHPAPSPACLQNAPILTQGEINA